MSSLNLIATHTALLVDDIEQTAAHLERTLSCEFMTPGRIPFVAHDPTGQRHARPVRACFTTDRSIELIEAADDGGPFARELGLGLHHYGGPVADLEATVAAQLAAGNEIEWELRYDDQLIAVFFRGCAALPGRLELVTAQSPPLLKMFADPA